MQRIAYRDAVARQPQSLADGLTAVSEALDRVEVGRFAGKAIGFAGIGASYQAALAGAGVLRQRGRRAYAYCPTDLYDAGETAADAFVALSASGQSREIADVMRMRPDLPRIAICRGADNPLAAITGHVIPMASGADNGASSTGYTGMLLAIGLLIERMTGASALAVGSAAAAWAGLPDVVARTLVAAAEPAGRAAGQLVRRGTIDIVGAGAGFATAGEAAMLVREAVRIPSAGWDTLNYLHGPMESQDSSSGLIAFGEGREVRIAQDVAGFGCPSVLITRRTDVEAADRLTVITVPDAGNAMADAIVKIVAAQLVVGDMQDAAGLTNCTFRYRQTDTKLKPWSPTEL